MIKVKNHQTPPTMRPERDLGTERRVRQEQGEGLIGAACSCRPIITWLFTQSHTLQLLPRKPEVCLSSLFAFKGVDVIRVEINKFTVKKKLAINGENLL